jgi:hypothetical protein
MNALVVCLSLLAQAPAVTPTAWKWADARAPREAWLDVQAIAEVEPSAEGAQALRALDASATFETASPRVGLWQLSTFEAARVLAALEAKLPGHFAPVFHDDNSTASKLRVPAGGVLVWLDPSADAARFVERHGLVLRQNLGKGTLLVGSAPGAASLQLTTELRKDPAVKTVMPNWWLKAHKR